MPWSAVRLFFSFYMVWLNLQKSVAGLQHVGFSPSVPTENDTDVSVARPEASEHDV
jgi:hypothetical protein